MADAVVQSFGAGEQRGAAAEAAARGRRQLSERECSGGVTRVGSCGGAGSAYCPHPRWDTIALKGASPAPAHVTGANDP
jgi:hypothetical protein